MSTTNDKIIRTALKADLKRHHAGDEKLRIVEEFCVEHGAMGTRSKATVTPYCDCPSR
jgi:hypothetical protein